jgi:hypothetical protein
MPNITRIVGMHNLTPEANRDAVWAGLVLRHDDGRYQFLSLNGRRLGFIRETGQPPTSSVRARQKFDQMYREKLAHGYEVIDWIDPRYGLLRIVRTVGDFSAAENILPADTAPRSQPAANVPVPESSRRRENRAPATAAPSSVPELEPTVAALADYIAQRTQTETPKPEPPLSQHAGCARRARASDRREFLAMLGPPLRRAILRHYTPDSCVASTAIGKLVLEALEIPVEPISVKTMLANHAFVQCIEKHGHVPQSKEERERWFVQTGAHAVGLGMVDPQWDGPSLVNGLHLAPLVDGNILDLASTRPADRAYGIVITEPFLGICRSPGSAEDFYAARSRSSGKLPGQGIAVYTVKPRDERYLQHPNWRPDGTDTQKRKAIAQQALRGLARAVLTQPGGGW